MAKNAILGKLNAKKSELEKDVQTKKETAAYLKSQIAGLESGAVLSEKQSVAVAQALAILTEAGVEV
jgi:hypothetical protein